MRGACNETARRRQVGCGLEGERPARSYVAPVTGRAGAWQDGAAMNTLHLNSRGLSEGAKVRLITVARSLFGDSWAITWGNDPSPVRLLSVGPRDEIKTLGSAGGWIVWRGQFARIFNRRLVNEIAARSTAGGGGT